LPKELELEKINLYKVTYAYTGLGSGFTYYIYVAAESFNRAINMAFEVVRSYKREPEIKSVECLEQGVYIKPYSA